MADATYEYPTVEPRLIVGEDADNDLLVRSRIEALDTAIKERPEQYLAAAHHLGQFAVREDVQIPAFREDELRTPVERLKMFLSNNDARNLEWDRESDDAIFADEEVKRRINQLRSHTMQGRSVKFGNDMRRHEDNSAAPGARDQLSMYKLFLYINRVRLWQEVTRQVQPAIELPTQVTTPNDQLAS